MGTLRGEDSRIMVAMNLQVLPDPAELAEEVAERLVQLAGQAIAERGMFSLVLCGGGTPRRLYELLASSPWRERIDWTRVAIYWGDERCVSPDHPESNYRFAKEAFLDSLPIPDRQIFRARGELEPRQAALDYERCVGESECRFDCVLLGLGADGHTASLFPGSEVGVDGEMVVAVEADYDGRPAWRVTMTPALLNEARRVLFLVAGAGKAEALEGSWGEKDPERWPAQRIDPRDGEVEWWVDEAALGGRRPSTRL